MTTTSREFNLDLRCQACRRFAYHDRFEGEYSDIGYTCTGCVKIELQRLITQREATNE